MADLPRWVRELADLADAATPGPWFVGYANDVMCQAAVYVSSVLHEGGWPPSSQVVAIADLQMPPYAECDASEENSQLIAASRIGVPRLCEELRRVYAERDSLVEALRELLECEGEGGSKGRTAAIERGWAALSQVQPTE
jgi:hypothetical protein